MKPLSSRSQLWWVGMGYAAVTVVAVALLLGRYLQERIFHAEMSASGGMSAFGDMILLVFIVGLYMIPTASLAWCMAKSEGLYTAYSQLLVGLSLSAPVCLGLFHFAQDRIGGNLLLVCLCRLLLSPFVLVGIGFSRLVARFDRARKLTSCALVIEGLTLVIAVALFFMRIGHR